MDIRQCVSYFSVWWVLHGMRCSRISSFQLGWAFLMLMDDLKHFPGMLIKWMVVFESILLLWRSDKWAFRTMWMIKFKKTAWKNGDVLLNLLQLEDENDSVQPPHRVLRVHRTHSFFEKDHFGEKTKTGGNSWLHLASVQHNWNLSIFFKGATTTFSSSLDILKPAFFGV